MPEGFIYTIEERCRMCYTCVRECPAKAIQIVSGQAKVIAERCIACGNCVRVCSQGAKAVRSSLPEVEALLGGRDPVAACVAPSFPAEFVEFDYRTLVGMLRAAGFAGVHEVAFGADLVAREYHRLLNGESDGRHIAANCPAVVAYVERYHPEMVGALAPVVSPMVAAARVLRERRGRQWKMVFIGPCIAKKAEAADPMLAGEVNAVITFVELRELFARRGIQPSAVVPDDFDPPHAGAGALFPISGGMLQAGDIREDLLTGEVVATQGRVRVLEAIREFSTGDLGASLLEALCCEGCIMGAGIESELPLFNRRRRVREFVRARMASLDVHRWAEEMRRFAELDLTRQYRPNDQRIVLPPSDELAAVLARMGKTRPEDELNCGACGYDTCREHAVAVLKGLAESEMCLPQTIDNLRRAIGELEESHTQLASAQEALVQSEKLASMGQLAAGIAHEVNNPLGIVLMYAHLLADSCDDPRLRDDLRMIAEQADRCKRIVSGLLHFARQNKVVRAPVDMRELPERALRGLPIPKNVEVRVSCDLADPTAEIDRDQLVQAMTNLITNAIAAMEPHGGTLQVRVFEDRNRVAISVADSGCGIPEENLKRVFDPFFTTKPMGKGTGLGLAVTYGIVKMHSGEIRVESNADPSRGPTGTTFTIFLPRAI